jgi:uncharacterized membrane protein YfcA
LAKIINRRRNLMDRKKSILSGVLIGFVNGIFGSGGGTVCVYMLEKNGMEAHKSHASTVLIILCVSIVSAIIYFFKANILWKNVLFASAGGVIGAGCGALLLCKIPEKWLHYIFGAVMVITAWRMFR